MQPLRHSAEMQLQMRRRCRRLKLQIFSAFWKDLQRSRRRSPPLLSFRPPVVLFHHAIRSRAGLWNLDLGGVIDTFCFCVIRKETKLPIEEEPGWAEPTRMMLPHIHL